MNRKWLKQLQKEAEHIAQFYGGDEVVDFAKKLADAKANPKPDMKQRLKKAIKGSPSKAVVKVSDPSLAKATPQALQRVEEIRELTVGTIKTEEQYKEADRIFGEIVKFEKWWDGLIEGTDERPGPLMLQRKAKQALEELNREITRPVLAVKNQFKTAMADYKLEEIRLKRAEQDKIDAQRRALVTKVETTKIPLAPHTILTVRKQLEVLDETSQAVEQVQGVQADHSHARTGKAWVVVDIKALLRGILDGTVPPEVVQVVTKEMNRYWREDQETVGQWPGVTVKDSVTIAAGERWTEE